MSVSARPPPLLGWIQLVLREGAAFSLPAFRGWWFRPSLAWMALGLVAHIRDDERLARARGALALGAAAACGHGLLAAIQGMVAGAWLWPAARRPLTLAAMLVVVAATRVEDVVPLPPAVPGELTLVATNLEMPLEPTFVDELVATLRGQPVDLLVCMETSFNFDVPGSGKLAQGRQAYQAGARRLAAELGLEHQWLDWPGTLRTGAFQAGTAVLSRYPLAPVPGSDARGLGGPPPMLRVEAPGGPLLVSPLHMFLPGRVGWTERRKELAAAMTRAPPGTPHVLAGDLNSLPLERYPVAPALGYQDAAHASPFFGGTWPAPLPLGRIDAVYLSGGLEATLCRVLPAWSSDHRGVLVRLRRRPGAL